MKKIVILVIGIFLFGHAIAQDLTVDEIVSKSLEALGQDKMMEIGTKKMTGKLNQQGMDFKITSYEKNPDKGRQEIEFQGMSIIMAIIGETGWTINPMMGSADPEDMPSEVVKNLVKSERTEPVGSWDNPFIDWKEKGAIELMGLEDIGDSPAYNLKFTFNDDQVVNYYVDASSFFILKIKSSDSVQGQMIDSEVIYSDYKDINGIQFPGTISMFMNGQPASLITLENIELDIPIDDSIFEKPGAGTE